MLYKKAKDFYQIIGIKGNEVISNSNTISFVYRVEEPSCYSLSEQSFDKIFSIYFEAFNRFKNDVIIHKQDIYLRKSFEGKTIKGDSFISQAEQKHFNGKEYLEHTSLLSFSISNILSLQKSYLANPFTWKEDIDRISLRKVNDFFEQVKTVVVQLKQIKGLILTKIEEKDLQETITAYKTGLFKTNLRRDILFSERIEIDNRLGSFYCINKSENLPDEVDTYRGDTSIPTGNNPLYASYLESVGVEFPYTHIVNQIWKFDQHYKSDFSLKVKQFGQHKSFDKLIERDYNLLDKLETELTEENNIICRYAFNVFLLEDKEHFEQAESKLKEELQVRDIQCYMPERADLINVFGGCLIGNENLLDKDYFFLTDLKTSLCLMVHTSDFKDDDDGVYFNERLNNRPFKLDLWSKPQGNKIPARNGVIIASTGGGKSVLSLNIVQQYIEQGYKVVVVEFGQSFKQLTQLYPDVSLHIDYNKDTPLGVNPFFVPSGEMPNDDKIILLANFIVKFMRNKQIKGDAKHEVSIKELLKYFYSSRKTDDKRTFKSFYQFIESEGQNVCEKLNIPPEYFNAKEFLHVCKDFLEGGSYENITKTSEITSKIGEKDFIVFELTKIKSDKFLVSVVVSIILDVIDKKLLDRSNRGLLLFDEYAEVQTVKDDFDGDDMHATVAFCYQKIRKENGSVMTVLQSPDQLRDDEFSKGIIANTQLLFVLPTTETVYDAVINKFNIKNQAHINQMKSIRNHFEGTPKYSEVFLRIQDLDALVLRLEMSPEKLLAFQTDGDLWMKIQEEAKEKGIEQAIKDHIEHNTNENIN